MNAGAEVGGASAAVRSRPDLARTARRQLLLLTLLAVLVGVVSSGLGSVPVSFAHVLDYLLAPLGSGRALPPLDQAVLQLRLPRVLAGLTTGGLLGLSGALMQVLLANPLADPYILGVSGGAAVAALLALWIGLNATGVQLAASVGALLALLLVLWPARQAWQQGGRDGSTRLLLAGVVLAAAWSACISLILSLAPADRLRPMLFWLMGDLAGASRWAAPAALLLILLALCLPLARDLNQLLLGEASAFAVGVPVRRRRIQLYLLASLAAALAVTTAGAIGFVGLLVPHALRRVVGNDQRVLLPASVLAGGILLCTADTAARTLFSPTQVPVGVLTALIGAPAFLYLLRERR